ncbi:PREDICTED: indole glucosinolate O-methyltransferase 1-like [Camelina sativa]|uniref:Indole glucosinolate O-methyltransferase 1-like n=1 Tax=Camelina sativa TaxID=90675 RepID=A0ABM0U4P3_CAMSA|nr:PREDICTED: indole glucosinolate O-methyltransferase 1-like [Camelina sativa]XP_019086692.1 PREDICTED: indole glucosinolate O-methyltransferase 1-like [Camelina sativa]
MTNHLQEPLTTSPKPGLTKEQEQLDEKLMSLQAFRIANSLAFPMVFKAALELGVFDTVAALGKDAWLSSSEIAFALPTKPINPEAPILLDRMLRLLVSHSIFKCRVVETGGNDQTGMTQRVYAAEPICRFFLNRGDDSGSLMTQFMLLQSEVFFKTWTHLKDVIQDGKDAFSSAHGMGIYEYIELDEQFAGIFNKAMSESSTMIMKKFLEIYKGFKDVKTLVDIGGGLGTIMNLVTRKYPEIKGINFDLAAIIATAHVYPGVEHVSGDMFIEVPKGDAIFLRRMLRDWNEKDCVKILTNCWKSLPEKGKVIIVDTVAPSEPKRDDDNFSNIVFGMDMLMLTQCSGGEMRSSSQFEALASAAGFHKCEITDLSYTYSIIEFHK